MGAGGYVDFAGIAVLPWCFKSIQINEDYNHYTLLRCEQRPSQHAAASTEANGTTPLLSPWRIPLPVSTPRTITATLGETGRVTQGASAPRHHIEALCV